MVMEVMIKEEEQHMPVGNASIKSKSNLIRNIICWHKFFCSGIPKTLTVRFLNLALT